MQTPEECADVCLAAHYGYSSYRVAPAGNTVMMAAFAALIPINIFTGIRYKTPLHASLLAGALLVNVVGHIGQLLLSTKSATSTHFVVYMMGTHWGATLVGSAIFLVLPHVTVMFGQEFRLVSKAIHLNVAFLVLDIISLALQSTGIILASTASATAQANWGFRILLVGLSFHGITLVTFLGGYWYFRHKLSHRRYILDDNFSSVYCSQRFKHLLLGTQAATLFLLVRAILRIAAFSKGPSSKLAISQVTIFLLDDLLVLLAVLILTVWPVGRAFGYSWADTSPLASPDALSDLPLRRHFYHCSQGHRVHKRHTSQPYAPAELPSPFTHGTERGFGASGGPPIANLSSTYQSSHLVPSLTSPRNKPVYQRTPYDMSPTQTVPFLAPEESPKGFVPLSINKNMGSSGERGRRQNPHRTFGGSETSRMVKRDDLWN
ncbi:hypothetical protein QBC35DRAFT_36856 [Podospora australis]|uniref:Uncharacterized protein n=1 Tax=Podospora australis TaxID=1536484 RepID=A0AAN6X1F8_9PEZI|nr:hypothetical protein QBC35DRAFT_36856 [Podospora australis]